ncbi:MAG: hypothetical protein LBP64_01375 [Tannerella sp.]|nr:hypothetical protein [Tannerella sp.]
MSLNIIFFDFFPQAFGETGVSVFQSPVNQNGILFVPGDTFSNTCLR